MNNRKKLIFLTVILSLISIRAFSHNLSGTITDKEGNPIPYATIYITNLSLGTTTNDEGKFEVDIAPGTYVVKFQMSWLRPQKRHHQSDKRCGKNFCGHGGAIASDTRSHCFRGW